MFVVNRLVWSMPLLVPVVGFQLYIRHNENRDLTASLLSEVCSDIRVEPALQPVEGEPLQFATAIWRRWCLS